ncbi:MAG: YheU family protein [Exilibacterium sp.]
MIIPYTELSPEALQGLIEVFITREGTDYGEEEISLAEKVRQVRLQLQRGDVVIAFDVETETVNILSRREANKLPLGHR